MKDIKQVSKVLRRVALCELMLALMLIFRNALGFSSTIFFVPLSSIFYSSILDTLVFTGVFFSALSKMLDLEKGTDCYKHCIRRTKLYLVVAILAIIISAVLLGSTVSVSDADRLASCMGLVNVFIAVIYSESINSARRKYSNKLEVK